MASLNALLLLLLAGVANAIKIWPPANMTTGKVLGAAPQKMALDNGASVWSDIGDPCMSYFEGWFYLLFTTSSSELRMARSRDITFDNWWEKQIWMAPKDQGWFTHTWIWAPAMHRLNGVWYIYFSSSPVDGNISEHRQFVLAKPQEDGALDPWTRTPTSVWTLQLEGAPLALEGIENPAFAIDLELMREGGELYGMYSAFDKGDQVVFITRMADPLTPRGKPVVLARPTHKWERGGGPVNEGPTPLLAPDGGRFVAFSASGAWTNKYCLGLLTLRPGGNPMRPAHWTKANAPIFETSVEHSIYGPGHNSFVKDGDGKYWIVYHARPHDGDLEDPLYTWETRETHVQEITWEAGPSGRQRPRFPVPGSS